MSDLASVTGDFETHLTVAPVDGDRLRVWARERGAKYTRIVLDRGGTPDQPMVTFTGRGSLVAQQVAAVHHVAGLRGAGFTVARVKIEASPYNTDVPVDAGEPGRYFEHHVKLLLADAAEVDRVRAVVIGYGAHLSRNARRGRPDGRHERFVTQRCHDVGRAEAARRLAALLEALRGHHIVETEREYVMVDDFPTLDDGWLAP